MKILLLIILLLLQSKTIVADTDYIKYSTDNEEEGTKKQLSSYKVKDFYGTWVVVKLRWTAPCSFGSYIPAEDTKHLGKKVIIKPNFYQNTMHEKLEKYDIRNNSSGILMDFTDNNAYLGRNNVFYSTEIVDLMYAYWGSMHFGKIVGRDDSYDSLLILTKDQDYHESTGDYDIFFIKDKDTLIYQKFTYEYINNPSTLYMLIKEEQAKKLDKYVVYVPMHVLASKRFCTKEYDEYAKKLGIEGKYKVIRDNIMAESFIDIE